MCGLGVPVGCRMKHAKRMGKRCGLGAALLPARFGVPRSFCTAGRVLRFLRVLMVFKQFKGFKRLRAGKRQAWTDAHKKPLMCGLGVPVGCRMKHAKRMFKRCGLGAAAGRV